MRVQCINGIKKRAESLDVAFIFAYKELFDPIRSYEQRI